MKKILITGFLLLLLPLSAKNWPHTGAKVSVNIPNSWTVEADEDVLTAINKQETVGLIFVVLPAANLEQALNELDSQMDQLVQNFKEDGDLHEFTLNGMPSAGGDGTGVIEGMPVNVSVILSRTPNSKVVLMIGFADKKAGKAAENQAVNIIKSLKPMR